MLDQFSRSEMLFGKNAMKKLAVSRVAIFGLGGVGGYAAEALARSGVGSLDLIDHDVISLTNMNRQIYATQSTIGRYKADVAAERVKDINPLLILNTHKMFFSHETRDLFDFTKYDYVVDAIDTVTSKIELIVCVKQSNTSIISSMGAGNKVDPCGFMIADIYKTSVCPLAKVMRSELKKRGIDGLKVVYSKETPIRVSGVSDENCDNDMTGSMKIHSKKRFPGSNSFVPPVVGFILAGEVIKDLIKLN